MAYIKSHRNQNYLFPPNLKDMIPENHICFLIEQITDELNYSFFDKLYAGAGHPAYHPRIILKLLIQGYIDGIRSARKLAKSCSENIIYIYLSEKINPDFRTISDFRMNNPELLKQVIVQVNQIALEYKMLNLNQLMIDGTSIKANASDEKIIAKESVDRLLKYIDEEIKKDIKIDKLDEEQYNQELNRLPKDLDDKDKRRKIIKKIGREINKAVLKKDKKSLDKSRHKLFQWKQQIENKDLKKLSFSDPDSKFALNKKKVCELGYNVQLTTEANGFLVSAFVSDKIVDRGQLIKNVDSVKEEFKLEKGTIITADAGYEKAEEFIELSKQGFELYVPTRAANNQKKFSYINFEYNEKKNEFKCPEGKILKYCGSYKDKKTARMNFFASAKDCKNCKHKLECCKNQKRRKFHVSIHFPFLKKLRDRINDPIERIIYNRRKETVERSIGDIKHNKNFRMFNLRGKKNVQIEIDLIRIAHNLILIKNRIGSFLNFSC